VVSDDEGDQSASADAFELLRLITAKRLLRGRLTVIDATNVQLKARKSLQGLAKQCSTPVTAILLNLPLAICLARNQSRPDRAVSAQVIERQVADLLGSLPDIAKEGYEHVYVMDNAEDIESATVSRNPI